MNNKLSICISLGVGICIGVLGTYKYLEVKHENILAEEVDSIKKEFKIYNKKTEKPEVKETTVEKEPEVSDIPMPKDSETDDEPYVISPDEFGMMDDYIEMTLLYYEDGTLTTDDKEVITDIRHKIGRKALTSFGKYEDDSVFVRNDKIRCDYEILKVLGDYEGWD